MNMNEKYTFKDLLITCGLVVVFIFGGYFIYDKITNPEGLWCIIVSPDGSQKELRGNACK